jgi:hypothetical protein
MGHLQFSELVGKTLTKVEVDQSKEKISFFTDDGSQYFLSHEPDCCESVTVDDIVGDLNDLVGSPIVQAEESESDKHPEGSERLTEEYQDESFTYTFYRIATNKGSVTIRWYGNSNGYYSESVDFGKA